ncbi:MAG: transglutaminase family protein [Gemmatimonadales bacterium]
MRIAPELEGATSRTSWIPTGSLGIELTIFRMRRLVRGALGSPLLAETAAGIVAGSGSSVEAAERIRAFLELVVEFTPDPDGSELLKSPRYMLREIQELGRVRGDCDDVAILGAALGRAVGLPARFVLLAFVHGAPFEHVYTELLTADGWLELDTTKPHQLPSGLRIVRTAVREA